MARSIENTAASLEPLCEGEENIALQLVTEHAQKITEQLSDLYGDLAPRAFGAESKP